MSWTLANSRETIETTQNETTSGSCRSGNQTQETKYLELPETGHTVVVVDTAAVDMEAPGGKTPNNNRKLVLIYLLLAARVGPWMSPKEPFPLTGMMQQNSGRCR